MEKKPRSRTNRTLGRQATRRASCHRPEAYNAAAGNRRQRANGLGKGGIDTAAESSWKKNKPRSPPSSFSVAGSQGDCGGSIEGVSNPGLSSAHQGPFDFPGLHAAISARSSGAWRRAEVPPCRTDFARHLPAPWIRKKASPRPAELGPTSNGAAGGDNARTLYLEKATRGAGPSAFLDRRPMAELCRGWRRTDLWRQRVS